VPDDVFVAKLRTGDYFGEQALLKNSTRNATIAAGAHEELKVAVLNAFIFKQLGLGEKLAFAKRKAVQVFDDEKSSEAEKGVLLSEPVLVK